MRRRSDEEDRQAIRDTLRFFEVNRPTYNENAKPFVWTKTEVQRRVKGRRISEL